MRHATFFSKPSLTRVIPLALVASVVLLGAAGLKTGSVQSLWSLWFSVPQVYLGTDSGSPPRCNCLNNATNLANGQFTDTITITSDPGEIWTVVSSFGMFTSASPAPPAAPLPVTPGTQFLETATGSGIYRLVVRHVDAVGFTMTASNGIGGDVNISSTCYYPDPTILGLSSQYCTTSLPVTLQGTAGAGVVGTGSFTVNGNPATTFNPNALGPGTYNVTYTFNAGEGTPFNPNDPACTASVTQSVQVVNIPTLVGISFVNVPMNSQCYAKITPDMLLSGNYPCMDDFYVTVYDVPGNPIGDSLGAEWVGFTLRADVRSRAGNLRVESMITLFDDVRPSITCPADATRGVLTRNQQTLNGALMPSDPSVVLSSISCFLGQTNPAMGNHYYDTYTFTVNSREQYVFELNPQFGRGVAVLYKGAFNPAFPCMNVIDMADDGVLFIMPDSIIRMSATLDTNQVYTLFTSSQTPGATGAYQWRIYNNGSSLINNLSHTVVRDTFDLVCNDTDSIFNNPRSLSLTGMPIAVDNCSSDVTVTFSDVRVNPPPGNCGDEIITRTFVARDGSNNTDTCRQIIRVRKPRINDLKFPPISTIIDCNVGFDTTATGNPHPRATGYPYIETAYGIYYVNPRFCNLTAAWQDEPRIDNSLPNVYTFIRRWTVFDDCNPTQIITYNQIIRVDDFSPPIIACAPTADLDGDGTPDPLVFSTETNDTTAIVQVPPPTIIDDCSSVTFSVEIITDVRIPILGPQGQVLGFNTQTQVIATVPTGGSPFVSGIPIGDHRFRYIARDIRGNISMIECPFSVVDDVNPTVVCDDNLVVSVNNTGTARIFAQDVNEGSSDNVGLASIEIRRRFTRDPANCVEVNPYFSNWSNFVEVNCCDVGSVIMVELRVTDVNGNVNTCMSEVTVSDNLRPICQAPAARTIGCDVLPEDFDPTDLTLLASLFGSPVALDNCPGATATELTPIVTLGSCGNGTIVRRFRATDASGNVSANTCQQVVTINLVHNYSIRFPKDAMAECGFPDQVDTLLVQAAGCANMAVSVQNQTFNTTSDGCYKILRTYRVMNWCEYDGFSPPIVISRDEDCDGTAGEEEVWVLRRPTQTFVDRTNNQLDGIPAANTRGVSCTGSSNPAGHWRTVSSNGFWEYTQHIKVFDSSRPTATFTPPAPACTSGTNCTAAVNVMFVVNELCSPNTVSVNVTLDAFSDGITDGPVPASSIVANYPNYSISGTYPIGSHQFIVNLADGCGNTNMITIPFSVVDCVGPTPSCIAGIAVPLMPLPPNTDADGDGDFDAGAAMLQAIDFIASPITQECSGPVRYSINLAGQIPSPTQTSLVLTCDNLGTQIIEVYAWDNANNPTRVQPNGTVGGRNFGFCQTFVIVQAGGQVNCGGIMLTGMISGRILNELGQAVPQVDVNVSGYMAMSTNTEADGNYFAEDLPHGGPYTITPYRDNNAINGVTTFDLIQINKHILGTQLLGSPYKMIAADANNSKSITTLDIIQIRRVILGLANTYPNNTTWRFIDASFTFPDPTNPWLTPFPEVIQINSLSATLNNRNFVAVKIGDVNNSASLTSDMVDDRSFAGTFTLYSDAMTMEKGKEITAPVTARNWMGIDGFQMTVAFDPEKLEFLDVVYGVLGAEHIGLELTEAGLITVSWNRQGNPFSSGADPSYEGETLFWISFRPKVNGNLEQALAINSAYTAAEAYDPQGDILEVLLQFEQEKVTEDRFELYQNEPNPFNGQTMIGFRLPEDDFFVMRIHDASGKVLKEQRGYFEAGYNKMWVNSADIPSSGVLYYTLTSGTHSATRKMVVIK
jgi:hypothetical protein